MRASEFQRGVFLKVFLSIHNTRNKATPWNALDWGNRIRDVFTSKQDVEDMYPIQRLRKLLRVDSNKIDQQVSKEHQRLQHRERSRTLEKSNFRPTDLETKKFKKEIFKQRWSIGLKKTQLIWEHKKVSPAKSSVGSSLATPQANTENVSPSG